MKCTWECFIDDYPDADDLPLLAVLEAFFFYITSGNSEKVQSIMREVSTK